jgi:hypothetical protein
MGQRRVEGLTDSVGVIEKWSGYEFAHRMSDLFW